MSEIMPELTEDIEVVGPGEMLAEARRKRALSQQEVADKLNFRVSLVSDIELEKFDKSLPETYNRGYLKNYAKLVDISEYDVLTSYDMLNVGKTQNAEMLSFSKGTVKEAENNLLMWISYLILAVLVGLTVMWWLQDENRTLTFTPAPTKPVITATTEKVLAEKQPSAAEIIEQVSLNKEIDISNREVQDGAAGGATGESMPVVTNNSSNDENSIDFVNNDTDVLSPTLTNNVEGTSIEETLVVDTTDVVEVTAKELIENDELIVDAPTVDVTFTFSGDCWVNIYDAKGERIAWGIKKLGYVMNINGQAPFNVTLGKPELVTVNFDGQTVDMSQFRVGQIAKFSLPIAS
jgi:cytoskeleton protein RodZ